MRYSFVAATLALATFASAAPSLHVRQSQDECETTYNTCLKTRSEVACQCDLAACVGEDSARERDFCATATAGEVASSTVAAAANTYTSTQTFTSINGIPGGCNPAHPGSCPTPAPGVTVVTVAAGDAVSATATDSAAYTAPAVDTYTSTSTFTSIYGIPGGCNPAHPGSCPTPSAGVTVVTVAAGDAVSFTASSVAATAPAVYTAPAANTYTSTSTFTSINGIPGGCNPAHPGSCPTPAAGVTVVTVGSGDAVSATAPAVYTAPAASAPASAPAVVANGTAASGTAAAVPPVYTGAADRVKPAMAIIALAVGALAYF